ncbi:MAG: FAD binding domain-containing protein [Anaerolineaceae bacterium]
MILEYLRPNTLDEAIKLLQRTDPHTCPLGGGSEVSKGGSQPIAVVDLQKLGLNKNYRNNGMVDLGATSTLSEIEAFLQDDVFSSVIRIQAGKNQRNSGTIAGLVKNANGRSSLLVLLLALDAQLLWQPGDKVISLGNWLPMRNQWHEAELITKISISDVVHRFESVARTPKDQPIVSVAVSKWPSGRLRVTVGGFGEIPTLALDGDSRDDVEMAVDQAFYNSSDEWASADYRREAGKKLAARLVSEINDVSEERKK